MTITLDRLDHLVLTVADIKRTIAFYTGILGMQEVTFGTRKALRFGNQQINLHERGHEFEPKAASPTPGSGDLCFLLSVPLEQVTRELEQAQVRIELGPVERSGAAGALRSVYLRDPDGNLLEISNRV
jgi:catechol 2,3-dioxygenase-like lactoylglutathione lyase family enzyme